MKKIKPTLEIFKDGASPNKRPKINFIEGTGLTVNLSDDGTNNRTDITLSATGSEFIPLKVSLMNDVSIPVDKQFLVCGTFCVDADLELLGSLVVI